MKNKSMIIIVTLFLSVLQTGCQKNVTPENTYPVTVKVNGKIADLIQIDVSKDTLIARKPDEDVDFNVERDIFTPLLQQENKITAKLNDTIEITFHDLPDRAVLYDHLLTTGGTSYFNCSIEEHEIIPGQKPTAIDLKYHISAALSSDSHFLKDSSIRGFRLVTETNDSLEEYAFVVHVGK